MAKVVAFSGSSAITFLLRVTILCRVAIGPEIENLSTVDFSVRRECIARTHEAQIKKNQINENNVFELKESNDKYP